MIYDCFTFFNELDLLEIRLNTLDKVVDKYVIVEANRTFQGNAKPMFLEKHWDRFKKFEDKITYIKIEKGYPNFFTRFRPVKSWDLENFQREFFFKGLRTANEDDRIIISDVDEIPNPKAIQKHLKNDHAIVFEQKYYRYFLNGICPDKTWPGPVMMPLKKLKKMSIKTARLHRDPKFSKKMNLQSELVSNGGWHFTTVGGVESIISKIEAFSHKEFNKEEIKNPERLEKIISEGGDIFGSDWDVKFEKLNDTYPEYLLQNLSRYQHLIKAL